MAKKTTTPEQDLGDLKTTTPEQDLGGVKDPTSQVIDMGQLPPLPKFYKYKGGK